MTDGTTTHGHLRAVSPCAVDPFAERLTPLSFAAVDWLIEHAFIEPSPASPLVPQYSYRNRRPRVEREEAGADLARRGLVSRAWVPDERRSRLVDRSSLGRTLAVLERPEQLLRLGVGRPDAEGREVRVYVAGGRATVCEFGPEGASVGRPFSLVALLAYLTETLDNRCGGSPTGDSAGDTFCLWPSLFHLATALWPHSGRTAGEPLLPESLGPLLDDDADGSRARSLLDEMVNAELAEPAAGAHETGVVLTPHYRRWLEPVWSGHVFEIEHARLADGNPAITGRLLFAGPPDDRVLCQDAGSHQLLERAGFLEDDDGEATRHEGTSRQESGLPDDELMVFTRPRAAELHDLVTDLLGQRPLPMLHAAAL